MRSSRSLAHKTRKTPNAQLQRPMSKSTACIVAAFANQPSRNFTTDPMGWLLSDQFVGHCLPAVISELSQGSGATALSLTA